MTLAASLRVSGPSQRTLTRPSTRSEQGLAELVGAARSLDEAAWRALVRRLEPTLRATARTYRLQPADVDDVVQAVWVDLFDDIHRIREPAAIAGWLTTATRRKAMRVLRSQVREQLTDDPRLGEHTGSEGPEGHMFATERRQALARAVAALPERHRRLITVLATHPTLDYNEISELIGMPRGSIGPSRARALRRLAQDAQLQELREVNPCGCNRTPCSPR